MYLKCGYKLIGWLLKRNFEKVCFPLFGDKNVGSLHLDASLTSKLWCDYFVNIS